MEASIHEQLLALSEPEFQKFSSSLLPGTSNILGVRLPILRKLAKKIIRGDWRAYLASAQDQSFEEIMLQGMVIGYVRADCRSFCIGSRPLCQKLIIGLFATAFAAA